MPADHKEKAFEAAIENYLSITGGYTHGDNREYEALGTDPAKSPLGFDRESALFPGVFIAFVKATQAETYQSLAKLHGASTDSVILDDLCKALDGQAGCLGVLRHGFKCFGKLISAAYFAPAHGMNPDTLAQSRANALTLTRQVHYSTKNQNSVDLLIALNGIPVATAELKNHMTGQNVEHAKHQYRSDRDPREKIFQFKARTLVHFAVDPDLVFMTTKLDGGKTVFLPFNRGNGTGAGNPDNRKGYKTAYLWEEIWQRDSFLDILARFVHVQAEERTIGGKKIRREWMIFPRYRQLRCVRAAEAHAKANGVGNNYLIQHSAGSGKSNSIAWLAHRLASLHNTDDKRVFDSVIVITDRRVLDKQLQDTIFQFEHKQGVVQKIDEDSTQLADSLKAGTAIVVTTLQKFPFVTEKAGDLPGRRYAVIIDEAHSSQSGEAAIELKGVLASEAIRKEARYQTGFDQPLLHTMYVDKRLDGVQAVQTLSRLNRTATGKEDTFVLDFVNKAEDIAEAFKPYYEQTLVGEKCDPAQLYELQAKLNAAQVYHQQEVGQFCKVFFKSKASQSPADHAAMNACLDPAVTRFKALPTEEEQEEFRSLLTAFRNLYSFLSQVIPFSDTDLEKLFTFVRFLVTKLPRPNAGPQYNFDDEITLKFYRLQKISEGSISLANGEPGAVKGPTEVGTGKAEDPTVELSRLIDLINTKFGTDFTPADELFFNQIREEAVANEDLVQAANANTKENFRFVFQKALEGLFIDRMEQNEEPFAKYMNDAAFRKLVDEHLLTQVYDQIRETPATPQAV